MTLPAEHDLEAAVAQAWPTRNWCDSHVVLAVSGGPDSVAMLRAVFGLKQQTGGPGRLYVSHLHHGLRGSAADEDQAWLEKLCRRWKIPLEVGRADVAAVAATHGDGWEAAARETRYEFLRNTAEKLGARFVAVGHTADDQVETVLHHILRGTGIAGLAGMPVVRSLSASVTLVRPLLDVRRGDVLRYLEAIGQDYRTDASNAETRWTRSRLRNELLPAIREGYNADVDEALRRLAQQAGEAQQFIGDAAAELASRSVVVESAPQRKCVRIDCGALAGQPLLVVREVCKAAWSRAGWPLQAMGFHEWQQLAQMVWANGTSAALNLPGNVHVRREADTLVLESRHGQSGAS